MFSLQPQTEALYVDAITGNNSITRKLNHIHMLERTLMLLLLLCYLTMIMTPTHPTEKHGNKLLIVHIAIPIYIGLARHLLDVVLATMT